MAVEGGRGGVMNWEIGIDMYTLICTKWITNKNLLYKKLNKIKFKKKKEMVRRPFFFSFLFGRALRLVGSNQCPLQ